MSRASDFRDLDAEILARIPVHARPSTIDRLAEMIVNQIVDDLVRANVYDDENRSPDYRRHLRNQLMTRWRFLLRGWCEQIAAEAAEAEAVSA